MPRFTFSLAMALAAVVLSGPSLALAAMMDSTKANVLRRYDLRTQTLQVTHSVSASGASAIRQNAGNDGGGWNFQLNGWDPNATATVEYDLGQTETIGSWGLSHWDGDLAEVAFEYWTGSAWQQADAFDPVDDTFQTRSLNSPVTASKVRYVFSPDTDASGSVRIHELNAWRDGSVATSDKQGYNWFRDSSRIDSESQSNNSAVWVQPNQVPAILHDGNRTRVPQLKAQNPSNDGGDRAFVRYNFDQPYSFGFGVMGDLIDQRWGDAAASTGETFFIYTANGSAPPLQSLSASDPATLQAAGWTLQHEQLTNASRGELFTFANPGDWQYLAIVWDVQNDSVSEFEFYAIPEPGSAALVVVGAVALLARRAPRTRSRRHVEGGH